MSGVTDYSASLEKLSGTVKTTAQETVVLLTLMNDQLKMITVLQGEVESLQKRVSALVRAKRWS